MDALIATTENCRYCLMCRHVAPVGHLTHDEALTPHGIALVVSLQQRGLLEWNQSTLDVLYSEPDGGNCQAHCVTDQPLPAAIAAVRGRIAEQGLAPQAAEAVHARIRDHRSVFGTYASTDHAGTVALFIGDAAHNLLPQEAEAAHALVRAAGIDAVVVGAGLDSGFIPCSLGYFEAARAQAKTCIQEIQRTGATQVLVLSAQDRYAFSVMYAERLGIAWPEDVEVTDLVSFLADQVEKTALTFTATGTDAAYIDPTHAVRLPDRFDAARLLCTQVLGRAPTELFWSRARAHPAGSTAIQFTRPDIATLLSRARLDDAADRNATQVLCEDPATLHALEQHSPGTGITVTGLFGLMAEQLDSQPA